MCAIHLKITFKYVIQATNDRACTFYIHPKQMQVGKNKEIVMKAPTIIVTMYNSRNKRLV